MRTSDFAAVLFFACFVRVMAELDVGRLELGGVVRIDTILKTSGVAYKSVRGGKAVDGNGETMDNCQAL